MDPSTDVISKETILLNFGLSDLPENWTIVEINDLLTSDRGISVGVMYPGEHDPSGNPIIKVTDLKNNRINRSPDFRISRKKHEEYIRTEFQGGELLITLVGEVGKCAIVPQELKGFNAARAIGVLRFKDQENIPFVRWCLLSTPLQELMVAWSNTTVQTTLNLKEIKKLPIPWPPKNERDAIVRILGSLDDKIELNRQMNETLEAMARAIFQSWFVDFDPVRAKAERRDTGMPPEIASLFPDGFEEVDGREVPRGWKIGSIYEIADVIYGAPFSSKLFNTEKRGLPLIRIRDLSTQDPEIFTDEDQPRGEKINPGDIIVGMEGEFKIHVWTGPISWLNQRVCKFAPKNTNSTVFLKYSILEPVSFFERSKVGTTIIHLGRSDIDTFRILIPSKEILAKFGEITEPISQKIVANAIESRTLARIRDALLPKLMSGEIQMPIAGRNENVTVI